MLNCTWPTRSIGLESVVKKVTGRGVVDCDVFMVLSSCNEVVSYILIRPWLVPTIRREVVVNASAVTFALFLFQ